MFFVEFKIQVDKFIFFSFSRSIYYKLNYKILIINKRKTFLHPNPIISIANTWRIKIIFLCKTKLIEFIIKKKFENPNSIAKSVFRKQLSPRVKVRILSITWSSHNRRKKCSMEVHLQNPYNSKKSYQRIRHHRLHRKSNAKGVAPPSANRNRS